jgi:hypothetical protein
MDPRFRSESVIQSRGICEGQIAVAHARHEHYFTSTEEICPWSNRRSPLRSSS